MASSQLKVDKTLPQSLELERAVLGSLIIDPKCIPVVLEILDEDCFYNSNHKIIFKTIVDLFDEKAKIDIMSLSDRLKNYGMFEEIGGTVYLAELLKEVVTSANVDIHSQIIKEKYLLRKLIEATNYISEQAYDETKSPSDIINESEKMIFSVVQDKTIRGFQPISDLVDKELDTIEERFHSKKEVRGLPTGFHDFDVLTSGLQPGDLIILAARPSVGKTSLALNIATNLAIKFTQPVGIFSLEMSKEQVVQRMLCSISKVSLSNAMSGYISANDIKNLAHYANILDNAPIHIDDTPNITVTELRAKARRLKAEIKDLKLIIVDYLQMMRGHTKSDNRQEVVAEITRSLKGIAKELNIALLVVSQLSRAVEKREDKMPQLADLRESGAIEQDSDVVMFIYRQTYHEERSGKEEDMAKNFDETVAKLIIAKNRNGPTGIIQLAFIKPWTRFESYLER